MSAMNKMGMRMPGVYEKAVEQASFRKELGHIRDIKDPRDRDVCADDGIVSYGQRIVSKAGAIRVAKSRWACEEMKALAGFQVGFCVVDYWLSAVDIYWPSYPHGKLMFRLNAEQEQSE